MFNIFDLFKKTELKLTEKSRESGDKYVFKFKTESPRQWKAGQDAIFTFKKAKFKGKKFRIFTLASSPVEKNITLGTIIVETPSEFKAKMRSMDIGDSIYMRGPFGVFVMDDYDKKVALIAGGVGITPMRAILKDLENRKIPIELTLFYVDSKKDFLFKEELEAASLKNSKIKVLFLEDRQSFAEELSKYVGENKNDSLYYISASPKMVKGVRSDLKSRNIKGKNIINHRLLGYKF